MFRSIYLLFAVINKNNEINKINNFFENNMLVENFKEEDFYDWFRGFCDAESNFTVRVRKNKDKNIQGFEFIFRIALHIDDIKVLKKVQDKLNCGKIIRDRNTYIYLVSSLIDIETVIIPLFNKWPLMTKKYLDFLDFKKSFYIFKKRQKDKQNTQTYNLQILKLKNSMNDKRVNFIINENHIKITANYLLGYIEGDGSFYYNKTDNTVRISLITLKKDRIILEKIKEFLLSNLDQNSLFLAKNIKLIFIYDKSEIKNRKPISMLEISQIDYICNCLIPFFDELNFRTKKYLDFLDFRRIAYLLLDGKHLSKNGKVLIEKLADTMNNSRLSTNNKNLTINNFNLEAELVILENSEPLIKMDSEGRALIINENKWIRSTLIIEVTFPDGKIKYFPTGVSCAKYFSVSSNTISRRLNDKKPLISQENKILASSLKRIKVFMKN
jgi:LAGLIDADG endonuclease